MAGPAKFWRAGQVNEDSTNGVRGLDAGSKGATAEGSHKEPQDATMLPAPKPIRPTTKEQTKESENKQSAGQGIQQDAEEDSFEELETEWKRWKSN